MVPRVHTGRLHGIAFLPGMPGGVNNVMSHYSFQIGAHNGNTSYAIQSHCATAYKYHSTTFCKFRRRTKKNTQPMCQPINMQLYTYSFTKNKPGFYFPEAVQVRINNAFTCLIYGSKQDGWRSSFKLIFSLESPEN